MITEGYLRAYWIREDSLADIYTRILDNNINIPFRIVERWDKILLCTAVGKM